MSDTTTNVYNLFLKTLCALSLMDAEEFFHYYVSVTLTGSQTLTNKNLTSGVSTLYVTLLEDGQAR